MKKIKLISAFIFLSHFLFSQIATPPAAGSGTEEDPLQIANLENLYWISQNNTFWDQYYIQTADIDASETATWFSGQGFTPIGVYNSVNFSGNYNGDGHVISNLTIHNDIDGAALFASTSSTSVISNLGLTDVNIYVTSGSAHTDIGALIGWNFGATVTNCYSTGSVSGDEYVGGLIGSNDINSIITNCYSTCNVTGFETIGGLIGWANSTVENCYASGNVSGDNDIGGFIGYLYGGSVNSCYSTGNVYANSYAAGFIDAIDGNITNCYCTGNVMRADGNTNENFAAFIDWVDDNHTVAYCYSTGSVVYENATSPSDKGFVFYEGANVIFTSNFFDYVTSGQTSGIGATPKLTAQMQAISTFTDAGWDFTCETENGTDDFWALNGLDNNGYPFLKFEGYVYDDQNPEITSTHDDQTLGDGTTCSEPLPDYTANVTATDNCDINLDVSQDPIAGTIISGATNTITLTVTDDSGNSAQAIFNVEVADNSDPTITCVANQTINLAEGETFYTVSGTEFDPVSSGDNCGIASVINDVNSTETLANEEFPVGTYTITWTITDNAGNTSNCQLDVIINAYNAIDDLSVNDISIYPNPTNSFLKIKSNNQIIKDISISDITGKQITLQSKADFNQNTEIDLTSFNPGIYILKIQTENKLFTTKIIKE